MLYFLRFSFSVLQLAGNELLLCERINHCAAMSNSFNLCSLAYQLLCFLIIIPRFYWMKISSESVMKSGIKKISLPVKLW